MSYALFRDRGVCNGDVPPTIPNGYTSTGPPQTIARVAGKVLVTGTPIPAGPALRRATPPLVRDPIKPELSTVVMIEGLISLLRVIPALPGLQAQHRHKPTNTLHTAESADSSKSTTVSAETAPDANSICARS